MLDYVYSTKRKRETPKTLAKMANWISEIMIYVAVWKTKDMKMYSKIVIRYIYADNLFEGSQYRGTERALLGAWQTNLATWHVIKKRNNLTHAEGGHILKYYEWLQAQIDVSCEDIECTAYHSRCQRNDFFTSEGNSLNDLATNVGKRRGGLEGIPIDIFFKKLHTLHQVQLAMHLVSCIAIWLIEHTHSINTVYISSKFPKQTPLKLAEKHEDWCLKRHWMVSLQIVYVYQLPLVFALLWTNTQSSCWLLQGRSHEGSTMHINGK